MAELKIKADSGGGTVSLKGPATTTSNAAVQLTLPVDDGTANQYLKTDGSGALSWATVDTSIADDSITEAKLDIHAAPSGTDKFLGYTSNGMEWAVPGRSKVLQHVWNANKTIRTSNSTSKVDTAFGVCSITPTKATSIIVVQFSACIHYSAGANSYMQLYFDTASSGYGVVPNIQADNGFNRLTNYNNNMSYHTGFRYDHDHNVTTELNYKVYWSTSDSGNTMTLNYDATYGMLSATEYDVTGDGQ
mgnify:CR=1 FL=1